MRDLFDVTTFNLAKKKNKKHKIHRYNGSRSSLVQSSSVYSEYAHAYVDFFPDQLRLVQTI